MPKCEVLKQTPCPPELLCALTVMDASPSLLCPLVRNVLNMLGERFAGISGAKATGAALASEDGVRIAANL